MKEQWQIEFTRKVCREHKLRYKISIVTDFNDLRLYIRDIILS